MDNNISKAEFLRNCFKEMLDDGKPHRYRELLEFARQQIQGTRFDEKIQPNLFIQYVNSVIKKTDSDYERVQFGIYQKKSPQRKLEIKSDNELDRLYSMLDCSCALKEQMEKAYVRNVILNKERAERSYRNLLRKILGIVDAFTPLQSKSEYGLQGFGYAFLYVFSVHLFAPH